MKKSEFMNLCDFLQKLQWGRGFAELFVDCGWCFSLNLQPLTELLCKGCMLNHNKWPHVVQRVGLLSESLYSTLMLFLLVLWLHSTHTHICASPSLLQESISFPSYRRKTAHLPCCASSAWEVVNKGSNWISVLCSWFDIWLMNDHWIFQ